MCIRDSIYILYSLHNENINEETLKEALEKTTIKRGSTYILSDYENILETIENDKRLRDIWNKY